MTLVPIRIPRKAPIKKWGTSVDGDLTKERDFITAVLQTCGALVMVFDVKGRFVYANRALEQALGYTREELKGQVFFDLVVSPESREQSRQRLENGFCARASPVSRTNGSPSRVSTGGSPFQAFRC